MWGVFFDSHYQPVSWRDAVERKQVSVKVRKLERNYPDKVRFFSWWCQIERLKKEGIPGDFAELGVYKGVSAKILHHMDPGRKIHLFDTFTGFRDEDLKGETGIAGTYTPANFADTRIDKVLENIAGTDKVRVYPGYFPETTSGVSGCRFAMVNIDADLYKPTLAALDFFYPRLSPGGVLFIHDYNFQWQGVMKAVDAFVLSIPEGLVGIPDMDGTVMIIRNK
jgi:O-methyltransferase